MAAAFFFIVTTVDPWATQVWTSPVHFYTGFFPIYTTVPQDPRLAGSVDAEPDMERWLRDFSIHRGPCNQYPSLFKGQGIGFSFVQPLYWCLF